MEMEMGGVDLEGEFEFMEILGEGQFGRVYKACHRKTLKEVAAKRLTLTNEIKKTDLLKEIEIMKKCHRSPYVVSYYFHSFTSGFDSNSGFLWIFMEICDLGSAKDLMEIIGDSFDENVIFNIVTHVAKGLRFIHCNGAIHRDVKAENIFICSNGLTKLGDFGVSTLVKTFNKIQTVIGTPFFIAPEMIQQAAKSKSSSHSSSDGSGDSDMKPGYNSKVDIWSLGITCIELLEMNPPRVEYEALQVLFMIATQPPPTFQDPSCPSALFSNFVDQCLEKDASKRPSAEELLSHPFLSRPNDESYRGVAKKALDDLLSQLTSAIKANGGLWKTLNKIRAANKSPHRSHSSSYPRQRGGGLSSIEGSNVSNLSFDSDINGAGSSCSSSSYLGLDSWPEITSFDSNSDPELSFDDEGKESESTQRRSKSDENEEDGEMQKQETVGIKVRQKREKVQQVEEEPLNGDDSTPQGENREMDDSSLLKRLKANVKIGKDGRVESKLGEWVWVDHPQNSWTPALLKACSKTGKGRKRVVNLKTIDGEDLSLELPVESEEGESGPSRAISEDSERKGILHSPRTSKRKSGSLAKVRERDLANWSDIIHISPNSLPPLFYLLKLRFENKLRATSLGNSISILFPEASPNRGRLSRLDGGKKSRSREKRLLDGEGGIINAVNRAYTELDTWGSLHWALIALGHDHKAKSSVLFLSLKHLFTIPNQILRTQNSEPQKRSNRLNSVRIGCSYEDCCCCCFGLCLEKVEAAWFVVDSLVSGDGSSISFSTLFHQADRVVKQSHFRLCEHKWPPLSLVPVGLHVNTAFVGPNSVSQSPLITASKERLQQRQHEPLTPPRIKKIRALARDIDSPLKRGADAQDVTRDRRSVTVGHSGDAETKSRSNDSRTRLRRTDSGTPDSFLSLFDSALGSIGFTGEERQDALKFAAAISLLLMIYEDQTEKGRDRHGKLRKIRKEDYGILLDEAASLMGLESSSLLNLIKDTQKGDNSSYNQLMWIAVIIYDCFVRRIVDLINLHLAPKTSFHDSASKCFPKITFFNSPGYPIPHKSGRDIQWLPADRLDHILRLYLFHSSAGYRVRGDDSPPSDQLEVTTLCCSDAGTVSSLVGNILDLNHRQIDQKLDSLTSESTIALKGLFFNLSSEEKAFVDDAAIALVYNLDSLSERISLKLPERKKVIDFLYSASRKSFSVKLFSTPLAIYSTETPIEEAFIKSCLPTSHHDTSWFLCLSHQDLQSLPRKKKGSKRLRSHSFQPSTVISQLECERLPQLIHVVRHASFPFRMTQSDFLSHFRSLLPDDQTCGDTSPKEECSRILSILEDVVPLKRSRKRFGSPSNSSVDELVAKWQVDEGQVYFSEFIRSSLGNALVRRRVEAIKRLRELFLGLRERLSYLRTREAAMILQKEIRRWNSPVSSVESPQKKKKKEKKKKKKNKKKENKAKHKVELKDSQDEVAFPLVDERFCLGFTRVGWEGYRPMSDCLDLYNSISSKMGMPDDDLLPVFTSLHCPHPLCRSSHLQNGGSDLPSPPEHFEISGLKKWWVVSRLQGFRYRTGEILHTSGGFKKPILPKKKGKKARSLEGPDFRRGRMRSLTVEDADTVLALQRRKRDVSGPESQPMLRFTSSYAEMGNPFSSKRKKASWSLLSGSEIIFSLLENERVFVQDMKNLIELFKVPVMQNQLLTEEEIETIFCNSEYVLMVHKQILSTFDKAVGTEEKDYEPTAIALALACLSEMGSFGVYREYVSNFPVAMRTLHYCLEQHSDFESYCEYAECQPHCTYSLQHLLSLPFERRVTAYYSHFEALKLRLSKELPEPASGQPCNDPLQPLSDLLSKLDTISLELKRIGEKSTQTSPMKKKR